MFRKTISVLLAMLLLIGSWCVSISAFAAESVDKSALYAVLGRIASYQEADYTPESYAALSDLYDQYAPQADSMTDQTEIDQATGALLEAISALKAYLRLSVSTNALSSVQVSFDETTGYNGIYTVVYGTSVTLTAPVKEGYTFAGWFETVSKRYLSTDSVYTFDMTVNTSLQARYFNEEGVTLTFSSIAGQVFSVTEKTAAQWAQVSSLDDLIPASVPYRYGYTNGTWNVPADALTQLQAGNSVTVTPVYDSAVVREFAPAAVPAEGIALELHYRYDEDADIGSFIMKTAAANGVVPESYGMLFYYIDKDSDFYIDAFDVNINNRMLASQFNIKNDDTYITNMKKLSRFIWAVKGYATYKINGETVTVYSNQVNVVSTSDRHNLITVEENRTEPTCTADGSYDEVQYCTICGDEMSRMTNTVAALGHAWSDWEETTAAVAATCTTTGAEATETRTCSRCNAIETRGGGAVAALGHDYTAVVTEPTCTEAGYTTYTCSRCGDTYMADETAALGHNFGEWAQTATPTCTATGTEMRTCSRCGATETRETAALGHDYTAVVTAPTCTEAGYTTYTCSHCGDTYTADETAALGHDLGAWTVVTPAAIGQAGEQRRTCSRCDYYESEAIPALTANIEVKLPNVDSYLYRAGNANNIAMGSLFKAIDPNTAIDSSAVTATITNVAGTAAGTFTANTSDWTAATVKFTGTGVVTVAVKQSGATVATLYLEIVAGTNYAAGATLGNVNSNNAVLLGDVVISSRSTINNGKTLYGNGFSVTDNRSDTSGAGNSYITMNGGGCIDNARLLGKIYTSLVTSGQENQNYAPGVWITGDANIYNSYVSETKNAVQIDAGTVYFENTTFAGGALANVDIGGGDVTFKNCVTKISDRGGIKGLGIRSKTASCKIHILGTLTQYNWLKKSDLPSTYSGLLNSVYNDSTYAYSNGGSTYVNMGIFFFTDSGSITQTEAVAAIDDHTGNNYGYIQKSATGLTATVYTAKAAMGSTEALNPVAYDETVNGQYPLYPPHTFDYTTKNYIARTTGSNLYCYYDNTTKTVQISFDKENSSSHFDWDPMILTVTKLGNSLPYTVSMNNTNYTNGTISFAETGDYQVVYTYTDPYNYDKDGNAFSVIYTKTVNISVTAVEPDVQSYPCAFNYDGAAGNYNARQVIGSDNKTYVMPDVSSTSSTIGSTTVAGQTVYYPIVNVGPTSSNGNTAYSSGKGYYFAPVFSEIHIRDYNQDTGAQQYEYSKSTSTWPHGKSATTGPDTAYFTCASGEKVWSGTSPYARSTNSQYYKYGKNNLGVCYTTNDIEKDNSACNHLVQYHYVSNDGTTYYYYVYYKFAAMTYASCVTDGTPVTMADGTTKPIEDVQVGDMVMTWSMWNGCYEAQPVVMHWYHGTDEWRVLTLNFSDGTEVRTIKEHGFFDADQNTYAYITEDNVADYIGDRFIKQNADGTNTTVTLTDYEISHETVGSYSIQTAFNENFMVEGMLSMTGEDYRGRFEYFDIGDGMKYDEAKMQADIARYGLYTAEEFSEYLTPEQFAMFNGAYFKVLVGKGVMTYDDIIGIIHDNLG